MTEPTRLSQPQGPQPLQVLFADGREAPPPAWLRENCPDEEGVCLLILDAWEQAPARLIAELIERSLAVVVVGWAGDRSWRAAATAAGAFGCLSEATPLEDKISLLRSARRYRSARQETASLRSQHDRLCLELVQSFGGAMEQLTAAQHDACRGRDAFEDLRLRVIRTLA
jgi:hypothetical protein